MRYFLAFIIPPLAILLCGRWVHCIINFVFWVLSFFLIPFAGLGVIVWLVCAVHALAICRTASMDKRLNRIVSAIQESRPTGIQ
jgi:hypothetical protein